MKLGDHGAVARRMKALRAELEGLRKQEKKELRRLSREQRERQSALLAAAGLTVKRRFGSRFWDLRDGGELIAVTVYRKGATVAGLKLAEARAALRPCQNGETAEAA
jgi:hypothetical protein